jgi:hypothetical protein
MTGDIDKKIVKLKDLAIDRCRERIEQAKLKAKELMNGGEGLERQKEKKTNHIQPYGVTSFLKKRHGL